MHVRPANGAFSFSWALSLVLTCVTACAGAHVSTSPTNESWPATLAIAEGRVSAGKYESADSLLANFAARSSDTQGGLEAEYWRALFRMDPNNPNASLNGAKANLDSYLSDSRPHEHASEAITIRRVIAQLDGLNRAAATSLAQTKDLAAVSKDSKDVKAPVSDPRDAAKPATDTPAAADAEIKRLNAELAKANAELERIRKRLAQPPPPPGI